MTGKKYTVAQGPAYVEIASQCNFRCPYCYNDSNKDGNELSVERIKETMQYLISSGVDNMSISGGEPFLHSQIFDIIEYAKTIGMQLYIITNASLLSDSVLERLRAYMDILHFQFSFDGGNEKTHSISRGNENFHGLERCIEYMVTNGFRNHIFIRYNITPWNFREIEEFVEKAAAMGCGNISLSYILQQGRGSNSKVLGKPEKLKIHETIDEMSIRFPDMTIKLTEKPVITCPYSIVQNNQNIKFLPRIDSSGNVYPCQVEVNPRFIIGNIYENSLSDIMNSDIFHRYIEFVTDKKGRNSKCGDCAVANLCGGGCVAVHYSCEEMKAAILQGFLNEES